LSFIQEGIMIYIEKLLEVRNLKKYYPVNAGLLSRHIGDIKAVDDVSFNLDQGEIIGLVGESGCGKSTLGKTILRLEEPTAGNIYYRGIDITAKSRGEMRSLRKEMQIIFQDPDASLDPRMTAGDSIAEAMVVHRLMGGKEQRSRVAELMQSVGLDTDWSGLYPHELSGGQKQRVGIARALAVAPNLIIADEPVSALDVSIQAQILNLMLEIHQRMRLSYIFITHDLSVIKYIADKIAVMYLGKVVEMAAKRELFSGALHPYTEALLSAVPDLRGNKKERILLSGDVPSPINPPHGCHFHTRCHRVMPLCKEVEPEMREIKAGHLVSCHLYK
jgi:oligopeptide/dipeptide ABC transporter ATP-binding protein